MLSTPSYGKLAAFKLERFKVGGGALARTAFPLFLSAVRLALRTERHGSNAMHSVCSWDGPVCVSTCVRGGSMPPVFSSSGLLFLLSMFIQPAESRLRAGRGLCTPGGLFCSILRFACFLASVFATRVRLFFVSFSSFGDTVRLFPSLQLYCRHVPCLTDTSQDAADCFVDRPCSTSTIETGPGTSRENRSCSTNGQPPSRSDASADAMKSHHLERPRAAKPPKRKGTDTKSKGNSLPCTPTLSGARSAAMRRV